MTGRSHLKVMIQSECGRLQGGLLKETISNSRKSTQEDTRFSTLEKAMQHRPCLKAAGNSVRTIVKKVESLKFRSPKVEQKELEIEGTRPYCDIF